MGIRKYKESPKRKDREFIDTMSLDMRRSWMKEIANRMLEAWNLTELKQLQQHIGGHSRMISNWIHRGSIPWEVIYTCHNKTNTPLDWLYGGKIPMLPSIPEVDNEIERIMKTQLMAAQRLNLLPDLSATQLQNLTEQLASGVMEIFAVNANWKQAHSS